MIAENGMSYEQIVAASVALGVPREKAERAAADEIARRSANEMHAVRFLPGSPTPSQPSAVAVSPRTRESTTIVHVGADRFAVCQASISREFDTVRATFVLPPRTKKNSRRFLFKESVAYSRYREAIKCAVAEANDELRPDRGLFLPMPEQAYNLAAIFYVDKPGEQADMFGLLQGIADALQDANVVTDDWQFRTVDGSRIVFGDERPRVEIVITPIQD